MSKFIKWLIISGILVIGLLGSLVLTYSTIMVPMVSGNNAEWYTKEIASNSPIKIYFNQPMQKELTENSFKIEPLIEGDFSWDNNKTLVFTPTTKLKIDSTYFVTIDKKAKSIFYKELLVSYRGKFIIIGPPSVSLVIPYIEEAENASGSGIKYPVVGFNQKITVIFDRPIRPLQLLDIEDSLVDYLKISPQVSGEYKFIGSNSFEFIPDFLPMGTIFEAKVPAGVKTLDGGQTPDDFIWHFSTPPLKIIGNNPIDQSDIWIPSKEMNISFNQSVDLGELRKHFQIYPSNDFNEGDYINNGFYNGEFSYGLDSDGRVDKREIRIQPDPILKLDTEYKIIITKGLVGLEGDLALENDFELSFKTLAKAILLETSPVNNDINYKKNSITLELSTPIVVDNLKQYLSIKPNIDEVEITSSRNDRHIYINYDFEPSTSYTFKIKAGLTDIIGQEISGLPLELSFKSAPLDPYFSLLRRGNQSVFNSNQPLSFYLKNLNISNFDYKYCPVSNDEFIKTDAGYDWYKYDCKKVNAIKVPLKGEVNKYDVYPLGIDDNQNKLNKGLYFFDFSSDEYLNYRGEPRHYKQAVILANVALVVKYTNQEVLVWALDFENGEPIADLPLKFFDENGKNIFTAKTNENGLFKTEREMVDTFYVVSETDKYFGIVGNNWKSGISHWDYNIKSDWYNGPKNFIYTYTDRPIYRPGQKVFFKGMVRREGEYELMLPDEKSDIKIIIEDASYNNVHEETITLSPNGTFSGEFILDPKATVGTYGLRVEMADNDKNGYYYRQFWVEEYRKPEYKVDIINDQEEYVNGETLTADIKGEYYFGGAMRNAEVKWNLIKEPYYFNEYKGEWYNFADTDNFYRCYWYCSPEQKEVASGNGNLNEQGVFNINQPINIDGDEISQLYSLTATITDGNEQDVSLRATYPIHQGQYYLGIKNVSYIYIPRQEMSFKVIAVDHLGQPLKDKTANIKLFKRTWNTVKKQDTDGDYYYENESQDTLISEQTFKTDEKGKNIVNFVAPNEGGTYLAVVSGVDELENLIKASVDVYITAPNAYSRDRRNHDRIDLVADKSSYDVGETAKIVIKSPFDKPVKALVTYERSSIDYSEIITLNPDNKVIEVPITSQMIPNIFISVALFKGANGHNPEFKLGYLTLPVNTKSKQLNIKIKPNKNYYKPGEKVKLEILTTDYQNKPVSAEISLAIIDQSILALKSLGDIDLISIFYVSRGLVVDTASNMVWFMERINLNNAKGAKGGGGDSSLLEKKKRGVFKDTAFWDPALQTDASGKKMIEFLLPDNLTTWQIIALGITNDSLVGAFKDEFKVSKDLIVRPVTPRFVIVGDEVYVWGIVHNKTNINQLLKVSLVTNNAIIENKAIKTIEVEAESQQKIGWKIKIPPLSTKKDWNLKLTYKIENDDQSLIDEVDHVIPIKHYIIPETIAVSGETDSSVTEFVQLASFINPDIGELKIDLAPTLLTNIISTFNDLLEYPYGCSEQVMSKMLPAIVIKQLLKDVHDPSSLGVDLTKIDEIIEQGMQKEYEYQKHDGGFGYWTESTESNTYLSVYILHGFNQLIKAGYQIDEKVMAKLKKYVNKELSESYNKIDKNKYRWEMDQKAFTLWVLSEAGEGEITYANQLFDNYKELSLQSKTYLSMSMSSLMKNQPTVVQKALKEKIIRINANLDELVTLEDRQAFFEESELNYWSMMTNYRTTTLVLMNYIRSNPDNPLIPKIIRWLRINAHQNGRMLSTQESTWLLLTLVDYLKYTNELNPNFNLKVALNKSEELNIGIDSDNSMDIQQLHFEINELLNDLNEININMEGEGIIYYDIIAKYFLNSQDIPARSRGIEIKRNYFPLDDDEFETPLVDYKLGETIKGRLTIVVPKNRYNVVIEEFLPAAFEAVNFNLDNVNQDLKEYLKTESKRYGYDYYESQMWRFNHREIRDDRVVLFADYLPAGVYEYDFLVRVTSAGIFNHLPAHAIEMYFPEVFGRTAGEILKVDLAENQ